jgi:hypothetical protein
MTAQGRITARELPESAQPPARMGDVFRGRFLDSCSIVERWATALLEDGGMARSTYFFGQKLQAVRDLAEAEPARFRSPRRVLKLLDGFRRFAELRTHLAHSVQTTAQADDGIRLAIFTPVHASAGDCLSVVPNEDDMACLSRELARLAKEFGDQRLKGVSPSSPPLPRPAAAADP